MSYRTRLKLLERKLATASVGDRCHVCGAPDDWISTIRVENERGELFEGEDCSGCGKSLDAHGKPMVFKPGPGSYTKTIVICDPVDPPPMPIGL